MAILEHQPPVPPTRRQPAARWITAAVLASLLVAVGAGLLIGRAMGSDNTSQPKGLASAAITKTLARRIDAVNAGNPQQMASFYAPNAVLEERDVNPPVITRGAQAIAKRLADYYKIGFVLANQSAAIEVGPYVAEAATWSGGGRGILVYEFDSSGRISYQWVISDPVLG